MFGASWGCPKIFKLISKIIMKSRVKRGVKTAGHSSQARPNPTAGKDTAFMHYIYVAPSIIAQYGCL